MKEIKLSETAFHNVVDSVKAAAPIVARQAAYEQAAAEIDLPGMVGKLKSAGVVAEADVADTVVALRSDASLALRLLKSAANMGGRVQTLGSSTETGSVPANGDDRAAQNSRHLSILTGA